MIDLIVKLQPKQKLFAASIDNTPVTFFGGAKGGGKSGGLRRIILLRRFKYAGSHGAIFRKSYPELEANHIRPLFKEYPQLKPYYNEAKKLLTLPNGSTLAFCYCEGGKDLERHQGNEYHDLAIDEAGQWEERVFRTLHGSNRSSLPGVPARCFLTGNPGGIGHGWLKRLFVERRFKPEEDPSDYAFIQALVYDNAALMDNDPTYVKKLMAEPNEALRKAYLEGDWDIFAGQFFQEISRDVHFIKPFDIPKHWTRFGSYDFGFNHPGSFGWYAVDEDGNVYKYRELVKPGWRIDQWAKAINAFPDSAMLYPIVAGHDCWTKKNVLKTEETKPQTIAEEFQTHGIIIKRAVIDRIQGAAHLRSYLAHDKGSRKPRFFIFNTCPITYDTLSRMIHDPDNVEDVLKVDATEGDPMSGDDSYDETRYGLMSRPAITEPLVVKHPQGSHLWFKQQAVEIWEREREQIMKQHGDNGDWPDEGNWGNLG